MNPRVHIDIQFPYDKQHSPELVALARKENAALCNPTTVPEHLIKELLHTVFGNTLTQGDPFFASNVELILTSPTENYEHLITKLQELTQHLEAHDINHTIAIRKSNGEWDHNSIPTRKR